MEDRVAALDRAGDDRRVGDVPLHLFGPERLELIVAAAGERPDLLPSRAEQGHDGRSQETASSGHEHGAGRVEGHVRFLAAQTASFSRKIFELWRMSTGNEG